MSKHKVTTVLTHYSHCYLRRNTVTHTSVFWRNLLPPSSLFSTLEMEDVGFSKKVDIPTTQKTLMWICEYSGHKKWVPHLTIALKCQIFQHYASCLVSTCISNWTDCGVHQAFRPVGARDKGTGVGGWLTTSDYSSLPPCLHRTVLQSVQGNFTVT